MLETVDRLMLMMLALVLGFRRWQQAHADDAGFGVGAYDGLAEMLMMPVLVWGRVRTGRCKQADGIMPGSMFRGVRRSGHTVVDDVGRGVSGCSMLASVGAFRAGAQADAADAGFGLRFSKM